MTPISRHACRVLSHSYGAFDTLFASLFDFSMREYGRVFAMRSACEMTVDTPAHVDVPRRAGDALPCFARRHTDYLIGM